MAYEQVVEGLQVALNAGSDLHAKVFFIAKVDGSENAVLCGSGEPALGVIREGALQDKPATVQFGGIAKVSAGAAFNAGVLVMSDGNGQAVLCTSGSNPIGIALQAAGAQNEIVSVALLGRGRPA